MRFKNGDLVVRKPKEQGGDWICHCTMAGVNPGTTLRVRSCRGSDIFVEPLNTPFSPSVRLYTIPWWDMFFDPAPVETKPLHEYL